MEASPTELNSGARAVALPAVAPPALTRSEIGRLPSAWRRDALHATSRPRVQGPSLRKVARETSALVAVLSLSVVVSCSVYDASLLTSSEQAAGAGGDAAIAGRASTSSVGGTMLTSETGGAAQSAGTAGVETASLGGSAESPGGGSAAVPSIGGASGGAGAPAAGAGGLPIPPSLELAVGKPAIASSVCVR